LILLEQYVLNHNSVVGSSPSTPATFFDIAIAVCFEPQLSHWFESIYPSHFF
jgi:hypothetical protein